MPREEDPILIVVPLPRFLFFITSVLSDKGRTTPCSFKNKPQALQRGCPSGFLRHRGVVCVKQFVHVVGAPDASVFFGPGEPGLEGARLENPDGAGECIAEPG